MLLEDVAGLPGVCTPQKKTPVGLRVCAAEFVLSFLPVTGGQSLAD